MQERRNSGTWTRNEKFDKNVSCNQDLVDPKNCISVPPEKGHTTIRQEPRTL